MQSWTGLPAVSSSIVSPVHRTNRYDERCSFPLVHQGPASALRASLRRSCGCHLRASPARRGGVRLPGDGDDRGAADLFRRYGERCQAPQTQFPLLTPTQVNTRQDSNSSVSEMWLDTRALVVSPAARSLAWAFFTRANVSSTFLVHSSTATASASTLPGGT